MLAACLFVQLLAAPSAAGELRTVRVVISDPQGGALEGLGLQDVALIENGSAREVTRLVRDERPLRLLLLLDTSAELQGEMRLHLVPALLDLLEALPAGARFALWKTGDRPTLALPEGDDRAAARRVLERVVTQGGSTMLDALVEATKDFGKKEEAFTAVLAVSGTTTEFSNLDRFQVVEQARGNVDVFDFVQLDQGLADGEARQSYGYVFDTLSKKTGGRHEVLLTAMAVRKTLLELGGELGNRYLLTYASQAGAKRPKLELQVARPGTRVRLAQGEEDRR